MERRLIRPILYSVYILMPVTILLAFLWAPPAELLGEFGRIIYFHVPIAWVSVLAFLVSGILSIIHLCDKKGRYQGLEDKSYHSAAIGLACAILTVITGSIWAKLSWGSFWNWDPRETSIVIILMIYVAYFSLHSALAGSESRAKIASVYLILAMATLPFFVFLAPRIFDSLHPDTIINPDRKIYLDARMGVTLLASVGSFTILFVYILHLMNRVSEIAKHIEEGHAAD